jgi:hypothetical protein
LLIKQIFLKIEIMQRTTKVNSPEVKAPETVIQAAEGPQKILYQKVGGGSLRMPNRIIKPGEKVRLYPHEISEAFRPWLKPLEPEPDIPGVPLKVVQSNYKIQPREEGGVWFDVVNAEGKVQNSKALHKDKAEELLKDLS